MIELAYSSGLRVSEISMASYNDIDVERKIIRIVGKGMKERIVPIGTKALNAIKKLKSFYDLDQNNHCNNIFRTKSGTPMSPRNIQKRFSKWGISKGNCKLHPHMLRHAFASHILESSGDLLATQKLLGHSNISTTQIYTHLDFQYLSTVYDKTHPRAKK